MLIRIALIYYVAILLLPAMSFYVSVNFNLVVIIFIVYTIFFNCKSTAFKIILPFTLILVLQFVWFLIHTSSSTPVILSLYNTIGFILPTLISFYLLSNNYRKTIKLIIITSVVFLFITSITSIIGLKQFPTASRELATGDGNSEVISLYNSLNIGGFGFVYMFPVVLPIFFPLFNSKKLHVIFLLILIALFGLFVMKSEYTIASITFVLSVLSFFFNRKYSLKRYLLLVSLAVVFVLFLKPLFADIFYSISNGLEDNIMLKERLTSLGDGLLGIDKNERSTLNDRREVYEMSIDTINKFPILGGLMSDSSTTTGGHSFILDLMALFGIVGWLALFMLYRQMLKILYLPFKKKSYYGYMFWSFLMSIILSLINTSPNIFAIGLFVPIVAFYLQNDSYKFANNTAELLALKSFSKR